MTAKDLLLRDKELASWWAGISKDERFSKVMTYCQNAFLQFKPDSPQIGAVLAFTEIMLTISENPDANFDLSQANPGLHHNFEQPPEPPKED